MAYEMVMPYHLHMPSYFLETFTEYPYLSTEVGTYKMYWHLADYLNVLHVLKEHSFVYFTSNKSSILELCSWIGDNPSIGNPFKDCVKVEFNACVNYSSCYTDIMLCKQGKKDVSDLAA